MIRQDGQPIAIPPGCSPAVVVSRTSENCTRLLIICIIGRCMEVRQEILLERAGIDDAQAILRLQILAYQSEAKIYNDYGIPPLRQSLDEIHEEFRAYTFLAARTGGEIVGSVRATCRDGRCYIGRLIVHPSYRRRGLGSRLMAAIETLFPEAQYFELFTGDRSEGNLRLYDRLGYREVNREPKPGLQLVYLEKRNLPK